MTPHPNASRQTRNFPGNGALNDSFDALGQETPHGANPANPTPGGHKWSAQNQSNQRRVAHRSVLNGYLSRPVKSEQNLKEQSRIATQGFTPFKKPEFTVNNDFRVPSEGASTLASRAMSKQRNGLSAEHPNYAPMAPMPSPRLEGGEGVPKMNGASPRPITVSP